MSKDKTSLSLKVAEAKERASENEKQKSAHRVEACCVAWGAMILITVGICFTACWCCDRYNDTEDRRIESAESVLGGQRSLFGANHADLET